MKKEELNSLQTKLRDKLNDVSLSLSGEKQNTIIVFLDSIYKQALRAGSFHTQVDVSKEEFFETYIGLNGDKSMLHFVDNKGIDNFDIFVKWNLK